MKLCFIDETSSRGKNGDYFAICAALMDAKYYCELKQKILNIFIKYDWSLDKEFKGSNIFDPDIEDKEKTVRFQIAFDVLNLNKGNENAKIRFAYVSCNSREDRKNFYLECLPLLIDKILLKANPKEKKCHKNLIGLYCDNFNEITSTEIEIKVEPVLRAKDFILVEEPVLIGHGTKNIGTLYADLFAYFVGRLHINGRELQNLTSGDEEPLVDMKIVKSVLKAKEIMNLIKSYKFFKIDPNKNK